MRARTRRIRTRQPATSRSFGSSLGALTIVGAFTLIYILVTQYTDIY